MRRSLRRWVVSEGVLIAGKGRRQSLVRVLMREGCGLRGVNYNDNQ